MAGAKLGRPPRTDGPERLTVLIPGELKKWLVRHVAKRNRGRKWKERRVDQGDVVAKALERFKEEQL